MIFFIVIQKLISVAGVYLMLNPRSKSLLVLSFEAHKINSNLTKDFYLVDLPENS